MGIDLRRRRSKWLGESLFSHVTVGVTDLDRAGRFYDAILAPLGLIQRQVTPDGGPAARCWVSAGKKLPRFYAYAPFNGAPATAGNGTMVAFLAADENVVRAAHTAGLSTGGTDEGAPGPRPHYGPRYFGAYLRDPDGNKIHIVYRGDLEDV